MACYYFKLIPETGPAVYISEPIKWDSVQIVGKRDPDWHGFNYEYTDGEATLEFDCLAGQEFIEAVYNEQGVDGLILLQFGRLSADGLTEIPEYEGKLNFATFRKANYRISCSVEKSGIHDQVKNRWDTKISLNAVKSVDEVTIVPPTPSDLELHSKLLVNNFNKKTVIEGDYTWRQFLELNGHDMYFIFNTVPDGDDNSNIDFTPGTLLGPTNTYPLAEDSKTFVFDIKVGGDFVFNINLSYQYNIKLMRRGISFSKPKIGEWTLNHYLHVVDVNGNLKAKEPFVSGYSGDRDGQYLNASGHVLANASLEKYAISLEVGDQVYVYGHFNFNGFAAGWKGIEAYIRTLGGSWDVRAETSMPPSNAKSFLVYETAAHILNAITNDSQALVSNFLGRTDNGYDATGCGALNMITNGFQIRQFSLNEKPPQLSLKDLLTSLNALYCLGMSYENNKMRIEGRDYFYQDAEILFIQDIADYQERTTNELIYNNIEIGYAKYLDEGIRLLDEFNTKHEYISPIKRHDNRLVLLSTLIGSGYAIETTRRKPHDLNKDDSTKYDDDCFIIAVNSDYDTEKDEQFKLVTGVVSPETSYNLRHSPKRMLLKWAKWLNGGFYYKNAGTLVKNTLAIQNGELTTQFDVEETCHLGDPQKDVIKEKDNVTLAQFDENDRLFMPEWVSFKSRISKADVELIRDCMTGQNLEGKNYGFIRTVMPNGNQVEGWLYEMSYNPNTEEVSCTMLKKRFIDVSNPDEFNCLDYSDYTFEDFEADPGLSSSIEECRFSSFN